MLQGELYLKLPSADRGLRPGLHPRAACPRAPTRQVKAPASQTRAAGFSECAMKGLAAKPRKGSAVLFWSIKPNGQFDHRSMHGACPVIKGVKWSAPKWWAAGAQLPR